MPRDTQGNYSLPNGTIVATGNTILPSQHNPAMNDIASALTNSLARNGNGQMLADLNMGGFFINNLAGIGGDLVVSKLADVPAVKLIRPGTVTWTVGGVGDGSSWGVKNDGHAAPALGIDTNYNTYVTENLTVSKSVILGAGGPARIYAITSTDIVLDNTGASQAIRIGGGAVHIHNSRGSTGYVQGSGGLRVVTPQAGGVAVTTYDIQDYTAAQFVRDVAGSPQQIGTIAVGVSTVSYNTSSDERLKTNFRDFDSGLLIDAIWVGAFDWKTGGIGHGVRAQQAATVFPEAVTAGEVWGADYSKFVPLLLREVQRLRARVSQLEGA